MPVVKGWIADFRPLVRCSVARRDDSSTAIEVDALIDTGSTDVMIQPYIAKDLGLSDRQSVVNERPGIKGRIPHDDVVVTFTGTADDNGHTGWDCTVRGLICEFDRSADILIGMNVLAQGRLVVNGETVEFTGPNTS